MERLKPSHCDHCGLLERDKAVQGQIRSDEKPVTARSAPIQVAPVELKAVRIRAAQRNKSIIRPKKNQLDNYIASYVTKLGLITYVVIFLQ